MNFGQSANAVIVGGGINGLAIGWYLARAGYPVTIVDRGEAGHGATWASAGTLIAYAESEQGAEWRIPLEFKGHAMWSDFACDLEDTSGMEIDYGTEGLLYVGLDGEDVKKLKHEYEYQTGLGVQLEWLAPGDVQKLEPVLSHEILTGLFCAGCHRVDPRKVALALRKAFLNAGGTLREHERVRQVIIERDQVRGIQLADDTLQAETVILAAGAWSAEIGGLPPAVCPPVHPVKGQMLAAQGPADERLIKHTVWGPAADLIPRAGGRLLVGATVEEAGFDTHSTAGGVYKLLRGAGEFFPGIFKFAFLESWAGLRPASPDDAPILGLTDVRGLIMATGHFKRGILFAPLTALAISRIILEGQVMEEIKPLALARFQITGDDSMGTGRENKHAH